MVWRFLKVSGQTLFQSQEKASSRRKTILSTLATPVITIHSRTHSLFLVYTVTFFNSPCDIYRGTLSRLAILHRTLINVPFLLFYSQTIFYFHAWLVLQNQNKSFDLLSPWLSIVSSRKTIAAKKLHRLLDDIHVDADISVWWKRTRKSRSLTAIRRLSALYGLLSVAYSKAPTCIPTPWNALQCCPRSLHSCNAYRLSSPQPYENQVPDTTSDV